MTGTVSILNVGEGDTKLSFDKSNPAECIRAARIVKDMLRRGYALLVEIEKDGTKVYQRVHDFDEKTSEYIIADFDPIVAAQVDNQEAKDGQGREIETNDTQTAKGSRTRRSFKQVAVSAEKTKAVAVGRTAGG